MQHTVELVDESTDTVLYMDEIDLFTDVSVNEQIVKRVNDPFASVDVTLQGRKTKRRYNILQKRYEGIDGSASKYEDPLNVTGYGVFDVVTTPYDLDALASLYDENAILRAVIDARSANTVGLGYEWIPTSKAAKQTEKAAKDDAKVGRVRAAHQKEIERLNILFEDLNEEETIQETWSKMWIDVLTLGNGYLEIGRTRGGKVGYVGHIPAGDLRVRRQRDGFVQLTNTTKRAVFFKNFGDTDGKNSVTDDASPNEILHFKYYSPNHTYYGIPPSVSALAAIVGDKFAKEYNIDYFENKAVPRYAIIIKGVKLSEKSKKELIAYFKNEVKGKNHGTLVIPLPSSIGGQEADVRFEKLEVEVQEGSFDQYRKSNRNEVIMAYRVPPTKATVFDDANLAVSRDADKTFRSQVCGPDQVVIEKKLNRIVKEFTDLFSLELSKLDLIDDDIKSRVHDRYLRTAVLTPNEVRQDLNMAPLDGGAEVLPYPTQVKKDTDEKALDLQEKQIDESIKTNDKKPTGSGNYGSMNPRASSPPRSGQDSGDNVSDSDMAGDSNEKGKTQDERGVRERA